MSYSQKFQEVISKTNYANLPKTSQEFIKEKAYFYEFSFQELKQLIDFAIDFRLWHEDDISKVFKDEYSNKKEAFNHIREVWNRLKNNQTVIKTSQKSFTKMIFVNLVLNPMRVPKPL